MSSKLSSKNLQDSSTKVTSSRKESSDVAKGNKKGHAQTTELAGKIEETDEMKLKMLETLGKPDSGDVLYPPELNAHLIEQLKVMTCENNQLRKLIFTKDEEIGELNKCVLDLNTRIRDIISGTGPTISSKSAGIISAKITELCKQNRHLCAELEVYKTKTATQERKIMQLELITKEKDNLDICNCKNDPEPVNSDEMKELNMKLAVVNKRLCDSRRKNIELKNEIITATKILQQELGEKFTSLKELQVDMAGWKGRAEKIVLLQARINELEEKLSLKQKEVVDPKKLDQNHIIKEIEAKKKREIEAALKEHKVLKDENQDLKKKLEAAKCRVRNLECDSVILRQKMQTFAEKSNSDDLLINEQRNQIKTLELYYQEILKENTGRMNKMHGEISEYQKLNKNTDAKIDALRKQNFEKTTKIDELRAQLLRYEECSLQSVFFTPMRTATDNEIQKLSELVVTLNERLDVERHKWEELDTNHRKLKERKKRLERKVSTLEDELRSLQESRRGSRASKASASKEYDFGMAASSITKKKSVTEGVGSEGATSSSTETPPGTYESLDKDELRYRLELTDEKLKILEDKLKMVEEEKQEDYNHLMEMIQNSKQLFNDALAVLQKEKCMCI